MKKVFLGLVITAVVAVCVVIASGSAIQGFVGENYVKELMNREPVIKADLQARNIKRVGLSGVEVLVSNVMTKPAGSFHVRFTDEQSGLVQIVPYRILSLVEEPIRVNFPQSLGAGNRLIKVEIDLLNEVDELNEDNNVIKASVNESGTMGDQRVAAGAFSADFSQVYKFYGNRILWLPDMNVMHNIGIDEGAMVSLTDQELALYPRVSLVKIRGENRVFYLTASHLKRYIPSEQVFNSYPDFHWADVETITLDELNAYRPNDLIRVLGDGHLYKLENGIKRPFISEDFAWEAGYDVDLAELVNKTEFNSYPTGPAIQ